MNGDTGLFGSIYENGELIFRQDEPGESMYVIQSGTVEISQQREEGREVLALLEKGEMFGELALLRKGPRTATARAAGQTRLLSLTSRTLQDRVRQDPGVALHILRGLTHKIYRADQRIRQIVEEDEEVREALATHEERASTADGGQTPGAGETDVGHRDEASIDALSFSELAKTWTVEESSRWVEPGGQIFTEGEEADAMYIILEGMAEISRGTGDARQVLGRLSSGSFLGELALISDTPRSATATAASRARLMTIGRADFLDRIAAKPEIALFIIQSLIGRLRSKEDSLADPGSTIEVIRQSWRPVLRKTEPVRVAIVSLSTCAGCSAVLLDDKVLAETMKHVDIVYCPMLMDQTEMVEADIALIDGAVRLKEDAEKLEEARAKCRVVVAWGTCASFGGVPAEANRYDLEDLIERTYGQTEDTFAHYLSGRGGVERGTYQDGHVALMRQAYKLDDFVRVDYYVSGCPPHADHLLQLVGELTGSEFQKAKPSVCAECGRRLCKTAEVTSLRSFPVSDVEETCFHSQGVMCAGFMTKGGCGAECTRSGVPCWGCRGPAKSTLGKMEKGDSFEEIMSAGLSKRCRMDAGETRPRVKQLRRRGHSLFDFDQNASNHLRRIR